MKKLSEINPVLLLFLIIISCSDNPVQPSNPDLETEWISITAGAYTWGEQNENRSIHYNYQIMKFEVTNLQYVSFLNNLWSSGNITIYGEGVKGYYEDENITGDEYLYYNFGNYLSNPGQFNFGKISFNGQKFIITTEYENHPVVLVTYYGAAAFAKYYGLTLPDEEEWEKTARGNTGWDYACGDTIGANSVNYFGSNDPYESGTTPVGFYNGFNQNGYQTNDSPSPYGAYDLTGNISEWTNSYDTYPGHYRMIRGGSWNFAKSNWLLTWFRHNHSPGFSCEYIGFRCVKK